MGEVATAVSDEVFAALADNLGHILETRALLCVIAPEDVPAAYASTSSGATSRPTRRACAADRIKPSRHNRTVSKVTGKLRPRQTPFAGHTAKIMERSLVPAR